MVARFIYAATFFGIMFTNSICFDIILSLNFSSSIINSVPISHFSISALNSGFTITSVVISFISVTLAIKYSVSFPAFLNVLYSVSYKKQCSLYVSVFCLFCSFVVCDCSAWESTFSFSVIGTTLSVLTFVDFFVVFFVWLLVSFLVVFTISAWFWIGLSTVFWLSVDTIELLVFFL